MSSAPKVLIILAVLSLSQLLPAELAFAQGRRGGGGGGWGWGGRGGGGPMTADDIAQRLTSTESALKNVADANGMIDADAANDFTDRIFRRIGKDPHYPVSVADIMKDYEANLRGTTRIFHDVRRAAPKSSSRRGAGCIVNSRIARIGRFRDGPQTREKARPFPHGPRAFAQGTPRLVPGKGR